MAIWVIITLFSLLFICQWCWAIVNDNKNVKMNSEIQARLLCQSNNVKDIEELLKWKSKYLANTTIDRLIDRAAEIRADENWIHRYTRIAPVETFNQLEVLEEKMKEEKIS